jgi:hypothetical protein
MKSTLTIQDKNEVTGSRLRLAQRGLIAAAESNPDLVLDDNWQDVLERITGLVNENQAKIRFEIVRGTKPELQKATP